MGLPQNDELLRLARKWFKARGAEPLSRRSPEEFSAALKSAVWRMAEEGYIFTHPCQLDTLRAYMDGYGVLISGAVGIGKTLFFRRLSPDIIILNMGSLVAMGHEELASSVLGCLNSEVVIDDLGLGGSKAKDYGREYDALLAVLNWRERSRFRTHFTTNLSNDALVENFDARAVDRIYGFAKCFRWDIDVSMREPKIYGGTANDRP